MIVGFGYLKVSQVSTFFQLWGDLASESHKLFIEDAKEWMEVFNIFIAGRNIKRQGVNIIGVWRG